MRRMCKRCQLWFERSGKFERICQNCSRQYKVNKFTLAVEEFKQRMQKWKK